MADIELVALVFVLIAAVVIATWAYRRLQAQRRAYRKHVDRAMR